MGCSPSKGQFFTGASAQHDKAVHLELHENNHDFLSNGTVESKIEIDGVSSEQMLFEDESTLHPSRKKNQTLGDVVTNTAAVTREGINVVNKHLNSHDGLQTHEIPERKDRRRKRNKDGKINRLRKTVHGQSNVGISETIFKDQQAAYAYLNPNIPKYESLLGLLDQATQSQLSLQPMVALLALRYEEINQALEEIMIEGEQMLEEHKNHMGCPVSQRNACNPPKADDELTSAEPPPCLLQQMLQQSTEKFRLVGDSIKSLGDAALEEAADYFASLSRLLGEKLVVKRETESRLKLVLAHVEAVTLRKPSSEDSALHSEDSGIGVDNEGQNGSALLRRHRESSGSGTSAGSSSGSAENTSHGQFILYCTEENRDDDNKDDDEEEDDDDDCDDDDGDCANGDEEELKVEKAKEIDEIDRKMSNYTQAETSQNLFQVFLQKGRLSNSKLDWTEEKDKSRKRPKTADSPLVLSREKPRSFHVRGTRRSQSVDCLYRKVDGGHETTIKDDKNGSSKSLPGGVVFDSLYNARLRRHSSGGHKTVRCYGLQYGSKGPFKASLQPSSPPAFAPAPPGRNAVKRLIDTFSQGTQDNSNQKPVNGPMKARGSKKCILPMLSNKRAGMCTNGNNNNNSCPFDKKFFDRPEDVDMDSLPPPPPEVLLDNSFESSEDPNGNEKGNETQIHGSATQRHRYGVSQRLRASLQTVTVLPNKALVPQGSLSISPALPVRQDAVVGGHPGQDCHQHNGVDIEKKETVNLQSRKIIHLCHPSDSPAIKGHGDQGLVRHSSVKVGTAVRRESRESDEGEAATPYPNSHPPTTPPVSRARLPPSCPLTRHRIPSPPALPPSPANPLNGQWGTSIQQPSSPNVQRWTRGNSDEESGLLAQTSLSFSNARSVFCQETQPASVSLTPSCRSTLPRPWGEPSRGRLQAGSLPQNFKKTSPSDHMPMFTEEQQPSPKSPQSHRGNPPSLAEGDQISEQETQTSFSMTDPHASENVPESREMGSEQIIDKQD